MGMYLMATWPWICISTTKKACERSLVADDKKKIAEFRPNLMIFSAVSTENQAVYQGTPATPRRVSF